MCENESNEELYHYGVLGMKLEKSTALNRRNASKYKGKGLTVAQASRQAKVDKANDKKAAKAEKKKVRANMTTKDKLKKTASKGKKAIGTAAMASLVDDVHYNGKVKKTGKAAVKAARRTATEAYLYKHGSIEVIWND